MLMHPHLISYLSLLLAFSLSPAWAEDQRTDFPLSHDRCIAIGQISLGPQGAWSHCRVVKTGWFATIHPLDLYQTQYCLGRTAGSCEQTALLMFANRAYQPDARLLLQRLEPGYRDFDDPYLLHSANGVSMRLTMRSAGNKITKHYYVWQNERWLPLATGSWQDKAARRQIASTHIRGKS